MPQVRVRMYRPGGVGDCFLLSFPSDAGLSHVLIDCGVLKGTENGKERMQALVRRIGEDTGHHLDVLVVTHEHWDHVSGFSQAVDEFNAFTIGEVWLAWTEKPDDAQAQVLRERKKKVRAVVDAAVQKMGPAGQALDAVGAFAGGFGAAGAASTRDAMAWAATREGAQLRYLAPGDGPLAIPGSAGARVFVLGPPRDETLLKRSDPSARASEVYLLPEQVEPGFAEVLLRPDAEDAGRPFDASFAVSSEEAQAGAEFAEFYRERYFDAEEWRKIDLDWLRTADALALQLDSDTNNTSLVLAIELVDSGRVLLFPGDAQVGNWLSWQSEACCWTVQDAQGRDKTVSAETLLANTVLYKVGHHASHNATLKAHGLESMNRSDELVALISVYEEQARDQGKGGWDMPYGPLLAELEKRTAGRVVRADRGLPAPWNAGRAGTCTEHDDYIECLIEL